MLPSFTFHHIKKYLYRRATTKLITYIMLLKNNLLLLHYYYTSSLCCSAIFAFLFASSASLCHASHMPNACVTFSSQDASLFLFPATSSLNLATFNKIDIFYKIKIIIAVTFYQTNSLFYFFKFIFNLYIFC